MSFKAKTIRKTHLISIRHPPMDVPKDTPIKVFDEAGGWGLVDVKLNGKIETGEMPTKDYEKV